MTNFSIVIETDRDLTPGEIARQLKIIHGKILECRVSGGIYATEDGEEIGEFFYELGDDLSSIDEDDGEPGGEIA